MRKTFKVGIFALASFGLLAAPPVGAKEKLTGEQKLAKLLEGRTAGEPKSCINTFSSRNMQVIDKTALVFRDGRTLWVNIPRNAEDIDNDDILVTRQFGTQLCRLDIVTTVERMGGFQTGTLFLGDFVPYRKEADKDKG